MLPISITEPKLLARLRPSLGAQILLGLAVVAIVVAVVAGFLMRQTERDYLVSLVTAESEKKFDLLLLSSLDDVISEDQPRIETVFKQLIERDRDLVSIHVTNEAGNVLFSWRRPLQDGHMLSFVRDVMLQGERFGAIAVGWDISGSEREVDRHTRLIAMATGGVCAVLSLLVFLLLKAVAITPIDRIATRVLEFRQGVNDRVAPLPAFVSSELRRLDESVNALGEFLALKDQREAELRMARDLAESASRSKTEFLATMSHELRTPLNAIIGFSDMIRMEIFGSVGDPRYGGYAEDINNAGTHLLAVISDILDIAKVEAGKLELNESEVDLTEIFASSFTLLSPRAEAGDVALFMDVAKDLPRVFADARKMKQAVVNLLSNAVKFTPRGGTVRLFATADPAGVLVSITDTGIGIPADKIAKALEPFGQVDSSLARRFEGTGLGLPLTKGLIDLHGGSLHIQSEVGVGTQVTIRLPASRIVKPAADMTKPPFPPYSRAAGA